VAAPLDARLAQLAAEPGRTWGVRDALLGLLAVPGSLLAPALLLAVVDLPGGVLVTIASLVLCGLAYLAVRRPARQSGGVGRALGFGLPRWSDTGIVLGWSVLLFLLQAAAAVVVGLLVPSLRGVPADNTSFLAASRSKSWCSSAVAAVVVAPSSRSCLSRAAAAGADAADRLLARRGALVLLFGVLHMASLDASGAALARPTGALGAGLCVLARRTGRLGTGHRRHAVRTRWP
jgi:hypothetical protein